MDDYSEPKDTKKFQWGDLDSPLKTNQYSDEEDEDYQFSQPYSYSAPGGHGRPVWQTTSTPSAPPVDPDDIYEISPNGIGRTSRSDPDYDKPPSRRSGTGPSANMSNAHSNSPLPSDCADSKHNGTSPAVVLRRSMLSDAGDKLEEDFRSPTWMAETSLELHNSTTANLPSSSITTSRQDSSNGSLTESNSVLRNKSSSASANNSKNFTRQRVIYPRKSNSSMDREEHKPLSQSDGPAVYEEAWDTAHKQRLLEENLRLARSISACSDTFEDALEYLPEDLVPCRIPSTTKSGGNTNRKSELVGGGGGSKSKTIDPITGGEYEPAWDLNRGLEEKLRCLQVAHSSSSESGGGEGVGGGEVEDGNYQEPWDLAQKQRELQERLLKAQAEAGARGANTRSPQHLPQQQQQHGVSAWSQQGGGGAGELYEMPWDTKKGLAHILQSSQSIESCRSSGSINSPVSTRSSQSVVYAAGEPINAMIPLHNQEWYHGNISRDDAERMLRVCKDGSYLVRDSSDRRHYTLSIKCATRTIHIQIDQCQKADGGLRYILGKNSKAFHTIPSMIDHYTHYPVPIKGAEHITLLYPVHCKYSGGEEFVC